MSQAVSSTRSNESNPVAQGTLQAGGVIGTMGQKLLDARLKAPVRFGKGERDVFEAPVRVHSGLDGVSKALSSVDTSTVAPGSRTGRALVGAKTLGKGLLVVGAAIDAADIGRSVAADRARGDGERTETRRAVGRVAGGWGGALAGASGGAKLGTVLPFGGPVAGMVLGSIVGGISGHIVGEKVAAA